MKRLRLFAAVVRRCQFEKFLLGFIICFFASAWIVMAAEPSIDRYGDALWYLFVACTSIGFGDFAAVTLIGRIVTVFMTLYEILLVALLSGVIVSMYLEVVHKIQSETATVFIDKMTHLTELSQDELREIEEKARKIAN